MDSMKRNGYLVPPILDTEKGVCYICKTHTDTAVHEIFYGTANRKISKANGFYVHLCPTCHKQLHTNPECKYADYALKLAAQEVYLKTHSREEFKKLIGRFYD